jgi:hypothetical protein
VTAVQELLVDIFVAATAVAGGEFGRDHETVMVFLFLSGGRLVAIEAVHAFAGVSAHLIFVDD